MKRIVSVLAIASACLALVGCCGSGTCPPKGTKVENLDGTKVAAATEAAPAENVPTPPSPGSCSKTGSGKTATKGGRTATRCTLKKK